MVNWEQMPLPAVRWWSDSKNKKPILQRLEKGQGKKDGERYSFERWVNVELVIDENDI